MRVFLLTSLAMIAFASNSLLCRAALRDTAIDAASFTFIRIFSGVVALWLILESRRKLIVERTASPSADSSSGSSHVTRHSSLLHGNWISAFALFAYAAAFSFAYNTLSAGTGALLLFGAVQASMILWGFHKGEWLDLIQTAGLLVAIAGLILLVFPGLTAPPLIGSLLMITAGVAWGIYSLRGKVEGQSSSDGDAIAATTGNFLRAVPFAILLSLVTMRYLSLNSLGVSYAIISGAVTSGLGYVLWYSVLPELKATSAAAVQLSAPVLAATGGILLLSEPITLRYVIAAIAVLGGVFLVVIEKQPAA
jgi:drug/metabolite transporter (DMT)-like permease